MTQDDKDAYLTWINNQLDRAAFIIAGLCLIIGCVDYVWR